MRHRRPSSSARSPEREPAAPLRLSDIDWFYEEPEATSQRLFLYFSEGRPFISPQDLKRVLNALKMYPTPEEVDTLWFEVESILPVSTDSARARLPYETFRQLRLSPPRSEGYGLTLNVLAEFSKYNCAFLHKGYITEDAIETALGREGQNAKAVSRIKEQLLQLSFNAEYRLVSIRELYCYMRGLIPNTWRQWACEAMMQGADPAAVAGELVSVGFDEDCAAETVDLLAREGMQSAYPEFMEKGLQAVVHVYA